MRPLRASASRVPSRPFRRRSMPAAPSRSGWKRKYAEDRQRLADSDALLQKLNEQILRITVELQKKEGTQRSSASASPSATASAKRTKRRFPAVPSGWRRSLPKRRAPADPPKSRRKRSRNAAERSKLSPPRSPSWAAKLSESEALTDASQRSVIDTIEDLSEIRQNIGTLSARKEAAEERLKELAEQAQKSAAELEADKKALAECGDWLAEVEDYVAREPQARAEQEGEIASLSAAADELSEKLFRCDARIASLRERERFYRNVKDEFEGYKFSVKKLLGEARKNPSLSARIKASSRTSSTATKSTRSPSRRRSAAPCRTSSPPLRRMPACSSQHLKRTKGGQVTFLPVASLKPRYETDYTRRALREPGAVGLATELVRYDEYYSNVVYNLIGNTLIAETIAAATAIAKK